MMHALYLQRAVAGPDVGALPPQGVFPATRSDLLQMSHQDLDVLAAHYGVSYGNRGAVNVAQRRSNLWHHICGV